MRPREQFSDTWHITLGLSHITLCVTVVAANVNKSLTYGLRVLPGRGGVVVIVAGGDVGVGVSPLVLHPRPPGVTLTMHRLVSVLRPAMQHYYKIFRKWSKSLFLTNVWPVSVSIVCAPAAHGPVGVVWPVSAAHAAGHDGVGVGPVYRVAPAMLTMSCLQYSCYVIQFYSRRTDMRNVACHSLLHGLADRGKLVTLMGGSGSNFVWARKTPDTNFNHHSPPRQRGTIVIVIPGRFSRWHLVAAAVHFCSLNPIPNKLPLGTILFEDYMSHSMWSER